MSKTQFGQLQIEGTCIPKDAPLSELLAPQTVAEAEYAMELIGARLRVAEAACSAHAEGRDDALLLGAEREHDDMARSLADDRQRLVVAIDRLRTCRDEIEKARTQARARMEIDAGIAAVNEAEELTSDYVSTVLRLGQILDSLAERNATIVRAGAIATAAGVAIPAVLQLPHHRRSRSAVFETRVTRTVSHGPRILDAAGNEISSGGGRRFGPPSVAPSEITRTETVMVTPVVNAPDLSACRIVLPNPDGGAPLVSRGR